MENNVASAKVKDAFEIIIKYETLRALQSTDNLLGCPKFNRYTFFGGQKSM